MSKKLNLENALIEKKLIDEYLKDHLRIEIMTNRETSERVRCEVSLYLANSDGERVFIDSSEDYFDDY